MIHGRTPEERWERIAQALLWVGIIFIGATIYGLYQHDDVRALVMTIVPAVLSLALWRVACWRRDR